MNRRDTIAGNRPWLRWLRGHAGSRDRAAEDSLLVSALRFYNQPALARHAERADLFAVERPKK